MISSIESKKSEIYIALGIAYVDVLYAKKWYQVTKKLSKLNQKVVSDIKKRKQSGASAELDLKLAEIQLGEAQIQQSRAKRNIQKAYFCLHISATKRKSSDASYGELKGGTTAFTNSSVSTVSVTRPAKRV